MAGAGAVPVMSQRGRGSIQRSGAGESATADVSGVEAGSPSRLRAASGLDRISALLTNADYECRLQTRPTPSRTDAPQQSGIWPRPPPIPAAKAEGRAGGVAAVAVALAETGAVPSASAASRAGDALVGAGAGEVWLFGSVARGEPAEDSDIDLVAVYADLDYARAGTASRSRLGWASWL